MPKSYCHVANIFIYECMPSAAITYTVNAMLNPKDDLLNSPGYQLLNAVAQQYRQQIGTKLYTHAHIYTHCK